MYGWIAMLPSPLCAAVNGILCSINLSTFSFYYLVRSCRLAGHRRKMFVVFCVWILFWFCFCFSFFVSFLASSFAYVCVCACLYHIVAWASMALVAFRFVHFPLLLSSGSTVVRCGLRHFMRLIKINYMLIEYGMKIFFSSPCDWCATTTATTTTADGRWTNKNNFEVCSLAQLSHSCPLSLALCLWMRIIIFIIFFIFYKKKNSLFFSAPPSFCGLLRLIVCFAYNFFFFFFYYNFMNSVFGQYNIDKYVLLMCTQR